MAEGIIATFFEIWETVLAVLLLLIISGGILYVYSPDLIKLKTLNNELSYIASIKGSKTYQIALEVKDLDKIEIENNKNQNQITLKIGDKTTTTKNYIGTNIEITKENNKILIS
jgi:hypothetical protein